MKVLRIGCLSIFIMNFLFILLFILYLFINSQDDVGIYCFEGDKCFTVVARPCREIYVIAGEWRERTLPHDNYLWLYITDYEIEYDIDVLLAKDSSLIVRFSQTIDCYRYKSRSGALKVYRDNASFYDSLYTQPSERYRVYRPEVCRMIIDVRGPRLLWGKCVERIED